MRLKEIKLAGFKSFADPTSVTLPGNRNAVVGPNGCGKSNVVDAVRWVMGESSARQLRGEALTDVIFNGARSRAAVGFASVEIKFDNRDGRAGGNYAAYAELAIRREVSRDSQSLYYLNGARCRRRDVADVFLGTGFGPRSYSIIEQGMISALVEAKPEELRGYLEEAAGVSKYKERRRETHNRIRHTSENLSRLADIRQEIDGRLAHLKRQAKAAERYRKLKEEQRRRTAQLHALRFIAVGERIDEQDAALKRLDVDHQKALAQRQQVETALEQSRAALAAQNDAIGTAQGSYYELGANAGKLEQAIAFDRDRIAKLEEDQRELVKRQEEIARLVEEDVARISATRLELKSKTPELAALEAEDGEAAARLASLEEQAGERQQAWEAFQDRVHANAADGRICRERIERGRQALQQLRERLAKLDAQPLPAADQGLAELERQVDAAGGAVAELAAAIGERNSALADARQQLADCERRQRQAQSDGQNRQRKLAALTAVQEAALGRDASRSDAEAWLQRNGLAQAKRLGEQLEVEPAWERAVEMVLDGDLQAVLVADAAELAPRLPELESGHLALLEAPAASPHSAAAGADGLPRLADFLGKDIGSLLAGIFAAESLDEALARRATLAFGESIATKDGAWLGVDWIRIDRGGEGTAGVIGRAREIEALEAALAEDEAQLAEHDERVAASQQLVQAVEEQRESLRTDHAAATTKLSQLQTERGVRRVQEQEAKARLQRIAADKADLAAQIEAEDERLQASQARLEKLQAEAAELASVGETLRAARDDDAAQLALQRQAAQRAHDAHHRLQASYETLQASLAAAEVARDRLLDERQERSSRADELAAATAAVAEALPGKQAALEEKLKQRQAVQNTLLELRQQQAAIDLEIRERTSRRAEAERTADGLRNSLQEAQLERERLAAENEHVAEQLAQTGFDLDAAQRSLAEDASEEGEVTQASCEESLAALAGRISRLGAINLAAIDEYQTESERKEYLDSQIQDLETALATLQDAIRRIDQDTRRRFKDTFEQVNNHLRVLFPKVFGGGHAELQLAGDDWLDTGVTLVAHPPGKRNASIQQLSGGEKAMAAVALIFAIFQLNPSPVCLLDEVDAPLDDANVERFSNLIREMSKDVQFVIITHNKQTIEMADYLLGVTMQEAGVSRLVSVDVDKAARMAAAG